MMEFDRIGEDLFNKIRGRFSEVTIGDEEGNITNEPEKARFFDFDYKGLGKVSVSISEDDGLAVIYSKDFISNEDQLTQKEWYNFLKELRVFSKKRMLEFGVRDITKSNLNKRDYKFLANRSGDGTMNESKLYGTSTISYQKIGEARIMIKHTESINQESATGRTQKIGKIYIESPDGERFKYPYKHLSGARAMARHVAEGGNAYDDFGKHIVGLSEEMGKLRKFKNYVGRSAVMAESLEGYMDIVKERISTVKKTIENLQKPNHYKEAFDNFETSVMEDVPSDVAENWIDELTIKQFNEELEDIFPYIYNLVKEGTKAKELGPDDLVDEGERHGNDKMYDKCWDGYKKVPGKKRGEKGSCVKEEDELERGFEEMMGQFAEECNCAPCECDTNEADLDVDLDEATRREFLDILAKAGIGAAATGVGAGIGAMKAGTLAQRMGADDEKDDEESDTVDEPEQWDGVVDPRQVELLVKFSKGSGGYDQLVSNMKEMEFFKNPEKFQAYKDALDKELGMKEELDSILNLAGVEEPVSEGQDVDENTVRELLKKFDQKANDDYRAYGDVNPETVIRHLEQGDVEAAIEAVAYEYSGDDGEEPRRGFDNLLQDLEDDFQAVIEYENDDFDFRQEYDDDPMDDMMDSIKRNDDVVTESEVEEASAIVTAKTMVDKVSRWIEELSGMENDTLISLGDSIRTEMGSQQAKQFLGSTAPAIEDALDHLKQTRDEMSTALRVLTGEESATDMLGDEPEDDTPADIDMDDEEMDLDGDDFDTAEPAAGGIEPEGREQRESYQRSNKLMTILAG